MGKAVKLDPLEAGRRALAVGDWATARDHFALALADGGSADAFDGIARARWWLRDAGGALDARMRAYAELRRDRRFGDAARAAVWIAREHRALHRNDAVAAGWLARARDAAERDGGASTAGWVALAEAELMASGEHATARLNEALDAARRAEDADLEIVVLAQLGIREVAMGAVGAGVAHLDESLAAASAGEGRDPQSLGEAWCALMEVAGLLGDPERLQSWAGAVESFRASYDFAPLVAYGAGVGADALSAFCGTCCGGIHLVTGRLDDAERALLDALADLRGSGLDARCVHPASQLAQLRVLQGRLEEAEALLAGFEDRLECVRPLADLELARGAADAAAVRLRSGIELLADQRVAALSLWAALVDAELGRGDLAGADDAVGALRSIVHATGSAVHAALLAFAEAKVAATRGAGDAAPLLRAAARALAEVQLPVEACRARLAYAREVVATDRPAAVAEARAAMLALDRLGATVDADLAAGFLRDLGVRGRTGPKDLGVLTRREQQVLRLVAEGLSNAEIASRLHISVKTAGHHVSNILNKLAVRSRTEAAAYALLHLPPREPARN